MRTGLRSIRTVLCLKCGVTTASFLPVRQETAASLGALCIMDEALLDKLIWSQVSKRIFGRVEKRMRFIMVLCQLNVTGMT